MFNRITTPFLMLFFIVTSSTMAQTGSVLIKIDGIENENGTLMIGLFTEEDDFLKIPSYPKELKIKDETSVEVILENIPYGLYAISIFHDLNENKELDTNFFKIPKEPFGFSNNYMPKFGPPSFKGASFEINVPGVEQSITIQSF